MYNIKTKDGKSYLADLIWRKQDGVIFEHMGEVITIHEKKLLKIENNYTPVEKTQVLMCS